MALNDEELLHVYRDLHKIFLEDLHIVRPLIQMLQSRGDIEHARELALSMARRMLAKGKPGSAIGFLELCRQLEHPDTAEIEALSGIARLTEDGPIDVESGSDQVFTLIDQLSDLEAMDFLRQGRLLAIDDSQDVVHQGEVSRNFYLILEGDMHVHIDTANGHDISLSTLRPGHFFGEFACVYQLPRSATVTSKGNSAVLEFSDLAISQLMQRSPIAGERLMRTVQSRLIHAMSYSHPAFVELPEADRRWLAEESRLLEFQPDATVTRQGEMSNYCCVIVHGEAIARRQQDDQALQCALKTGDIFGDAIRYVRLPKGTEVIATSHCLVCCIPKSVFQSFMNAYASFEHWVEPHGEARQQQLQLPLEEWDIEA
ncbi:MAG: cyclic nucleotide-binding domain-containing protein [Mariprofundaceae bacterium]